MASDKAKGNMKRAGWLFLVFIFVVTTFGAAVGTFWVATQNDNKDTASQTTPPPSDTCTMDPTVKSAARPKPEVYKPKGDVTKLETTDLKVGTGATIKSGDCVVMKYYGTLAKNGEMFDENYTKETGLKYKHGTGNVIKGWDQGLEGMKVGGERRLVIPSDLAYGSQAQGSIPANSDLVFVVYLDSIQ